MSADGNGGGGSGGSGGSGKRRAMVINGPFDAPTKYWRFNRETGIHEQADGRRPAGYVIYDTRGKGGESRRLAKLELAESLRGPVGEWRAAKYPGVTGVTRQLLTHWGRKKRARPEERPFFFCQLEAIETLIWLSETAAGVAASRGIRKDGGKFLRLCAKMATGTGKTAVMGMLAAWQTLNSVARPGDKRFSRDFLAVAPGLTVRRRLEVLRPSAEGNIYDDFRIVPTDMRERMNRARLVILNWHALAWESDEKIAGRRSVDKRGGWSDAHYAREVLGAVGDSGRLVVINDEAHHAWRLPEAEAKEDLYAEPDGPVWQLPKGVRIGRDADRDTAKVWLRGLDRLHRTRPILRCYDFSATPFVPTGHANVEDTVFPWIVSDFGLNDAIESGLVKVPRIVARDDALFDPATKRSRLWHIYGDRDVESDLRRKDEGLESEPLPSLVVDACAHLGESWKKSRARFRREERQCPPVMISVVNNTTTAARILSAARRGLILKGACSPEEGRTLSINSDILKKAEKGEGGAKADEIRAAVDAVGRAGSKLEHVISVAMLSEGWDAKTVTHILGLRPFTSQLLCEQVVGRGLRRMDHDLQADGKFSEETVTVFGVPFDILEDDGAGPEPPPPVEKTRVEVDPAKADFALTWPRVLRVGAELSPRLALDWDGVKPLVLRAAETQLTVEMGKVVDGKTLLDDLEVIDLRRLDSFRTQHLAFQAAELALRKCPESWRGDDAFLAAQLVVLAEEFFRRKVELRPRPRAGREGGTYRRLMLGLRFTDALNHFINRVEFDNMERLVAVLDPHCPRGGTADMRPWETARSCVAGRKCHISHCAADHGWEHYVARKLDGLDEVEAWVKNDHLDFQIEYVHRGSSRRYYPDFLLRLANGCHLILEVTGQEWDGKAEKALALKNWTAAVNARGDFGKWLSAQATDPEDAEEIIRGLCK